MCLQELSTNYVSLQTKHTSHFPIPENELKARATQSHLTQGPEDIFFFGGGLQYDRVQAGRTDVLFSLYANDMPPPSHHVQFALYADDTAIIATSRKPTLLVSYFVSYLDDLERWLNEWRISIDVSDSTTIIFARAGRRFIQPRPVTLFGEPIQWSTQLVTWM